MAKDNNQEVTPYPLTRINTNCLWCGQAATCEVPSISNYSRKDLEGPSNCLVPACAEHGRMVMMRVGPPREESRSWLEGTAWPLCALCGKTLENPAFGGKSVEYEPPGERFATSAHEECIKKVDSKEEN